MFLIDHKQDEGTVLHPLPGLLTASLLANYYLACPFYPVVNDKLFLSMLLLLQRRLNDTLVRLEDFIDDCK